jgi:hypothetical protein
MNTTVKNAAGAVNTALDDIVIFNWHRGYGANTIGGLSIYLHTVTTAYQEHHNFCRNTSWDEFLNFAGF